MIKRISAFSMLSFSSFLSNTAFAGTIGTETAKLATTISEVQTDTLAFVASVFGVVMAIYFGYKGFKYVMSYVKF